MLLLIALLALPTATPVRAQDTPATASMATPTAASMPSVDEVRRVVADMVADPDENGKHREHTLRWKNLDQDQQNAAPPPAWLTTLIRWIAGSARGLIWLLGAIAVAVLAVFVWRWASLRGEGREKAMPIPPSHVNALDIRPASLPDDIGAAAVALCQRGELRAALSLLYRGGLSRLVHQHHAAIGAASTEGECVRIAEALLPVEASGYFRALVGSWQSAVYAGRMIEAGVVVGLSENFDSHFALVSPPALPSQIAEAHA